jgi:uncharacterized caspase-like protein
MRVRIGLSLACAVLFAALTSPAQAEKRIALVIGNGAYVTASPLPNPANDARDVSAALTRAGFETILGLDLDKAGMEDMAVRFARAARGADVAVFYYSGHAMQFAGVNYLMPIDAKLSDEADLRRLARVDEILADLQQAKNLRILVLDSCRDNPLAEQLKRTIGRTRSVGMQRGLAPINTAEGMIVAYATQAGRTADDGAGRNSPYTAAFLKHIETPEEIGTVFRRVSADVYQTTGRTQLPELSLSLIGEYYLRARPAVPAPETPPVAASGSAADEVTWSYLKDIADTGALRRFTMQFPTSPRRREAEARIAALEREAASPKVATALPAITPASPPDNVPKVAPPAINEPVRVPTEKVVRDQVAGLTPFAKPDRVATQGAVLYEEDTKDPKGRSFVGSITWRSERVPPSAGKLPEFTLYADIDIPERLKMTAAFRRNSDAALPASHLVELQFKLPLGFAGGAIANVPGILMKTGGEQRGTPLAGLAVKVTDNMFLVGLSSNAADVKRNVELLKDRATFDIPIVYGDGIRAIISIEKGAIGERVFAEAFKNKGL